MALKTYKFASIDELNLFLAGGVVGGKIGTRIYGIVGTKVKFTKPTAVEYTFVAGAAGDGSLTFAEVKSQLEAGVTNLKVTRVGHNIVLSGGTDGVQFAAPSSVPGNAVLGFSNAGTGRTYAYNAPSGVVPRLIQVFGFGTQLACVVEE